MTCFYEFLFYNFADDNTITATCNINKRRFLMQTSKIVIKKEKEAEYKLTIDNNDI